MKLHFTLNTRPAYRFRLRMEVPASMAESYAERQLIERAADDYYYSVNPNSLEAAYKTVTAREIREAIRDRSTASSR